ncbi:large subunit ribosomal protein L6 [Ardenticatena maritima]|uniref:Large ribosomal subunit protein uL6 n=1 Tax=Ardenticatena maritima TaxID=872965 RepID=A0A0M8K7G6_9CHLR|nr:50S ribosomal protein L6 [Ardenticatena maritima]KPL90041.1 50S ribosomal protein L6 [Ardenticatena maritima]GAP61896.1 large subunit ribosomal protein L6 [Ardenticatena maritima]
MSRIGRMPVPVPAGVTVDIQGNTITVKGPKGQLSYTFHPDMQVSLEDGRIVVRRPSDERQHRALHGLTRALINNMVVGVSQGYKKDLILEGTGYRADLKGTTLVLNVGYSHPVEIEAPEGITFEVDRSGKSLSVSGIDKQLVGEIAARIRRVRPPEPYKGKGIRYADEVIRRKAGKSGRA